jgi:hypothetical protein
MDTYKTINLPVVLYHSKDRILSDVTEAKVEWTVLTEQSLYEICVH